METRPHLIKFEPAHLGPGNEADGEFKAARGPAFTAVVGEEILGSGGVCVLWPGVGEAWVHGWTRNKRLAVWFHKMIIAKINEVVGQLKLWRLQSFAMMDDMQARKWIERLGFFVESASLYYGPKGEHCVRFYKIYREHLPWTLLELH